MYPALSRAMRKTRRLPEARPKPARELTGLDEDIRMRIEETALQVFSERGAHRVNLAQFALLARTSLQTVYRYYGGKDGLLSAAVDRELCRLTERANESMASLDDCKHKLRAIYWAVLAHFEGSPASAMVLHRMMNTQSRFNPALRESELTIRLGQLIEEGRARGVLTEEVEGRVLLDFFWGALWRFVHASTERGTSGSLERANASFELLWRALARPE